VGDKIYLVTGYTSESDDPILATSSKETAERWVWTLNNFIRRYDKARELWERGNSDNCPTQPAFFTSREMTHHIGYVVVECPVEDQIEGMGWADLLKWDLFEKK